jgi:hypothetical protein
MVIQDAGQDVRRDVERDVGTRLLAIRHAATSDLSPAWYDTAQVVQAWLRRPSTVPAAVAQSGLDTLLRAQCSDGSWGYDRAPRGYRVVPTLAAVAALLAAGAGATGPVAAARSASAARRALTFLAGEPEHLAPQRLPDTIAVELIVPALLEGIERELPRTDAAYDGICTALRLQEPALRRLAQHRTAARTGAELPPASHHSLEVLGELPAGYRHADFIRDGCLACSPAATAAAVSWSDQPCQPAVAYLTLEGTRLGGAWPTVAPVTVFEAALLIGAAGRFGVRPTEEVVADLAPWLVAQLTTEGCGAGPALAPDSDDTAIVLYALHQLGQPWSPRALFGYEAGTHFATFPGERTVSSSVNAHVLDVLRAARAGGDRDGVARGIGTATRFLLETQHPDGRWTDKWHASPFYATACAVLALCPDQQPRVTAVVDRAIAWVLERQRPDGSWGCWTGTREETAYAVQTLLSADAGWRAVARGVGFLAEAPAEDPPLWHAKELYAPHRIVDTLVLITREAVRRRQKATGNKRRADW